MKPDFTRESEVDWRDVAEERDPWKVRRLVGRAFILSKELQPNEYQLEAAEYEKELERRIWEGFWTRERVAGWKKAKEHNAAAA